MHTMSLNLLKANIHVQCHDRRKICNLSSIGTHSPDSNSMVYWAEYMLLVNTDTGCLHTVKSILLISYNSEKDFHTFRGLRGTRENFLHKNFWWPPPPPPPPLFQQLQWPRLGRALILDYAQLASNMHEPLPADGFAYHLFSAYKMLVVQSLLWF